LTPQGERNAQGLEARLAGLNFDEVFTSPLQRAHEIVEWNYGDYEGLRSAQIRALRPSWELFRDGCPGQARGEFIKQPRDLWSILVRQ